MSKHPISLTLPNKYTFHQIFTFTSCSAAATALLMLIAFSFETGTLSASILPKVLCQLEQACNVVFYADALPSILFSSALSLFVPSLFLFLWHSVAPSLACRIHRHKAVSQQS